MRELFPVSENDVLRKHIVLLRKAEYHCNCGHKLLGLLSRARLSRLQNRYALHVPINTCGRGLHIMHLGPVLINGRAKVGRDCSLHINTALAAGGTNDGAPALEDGIVVGFGAVVLGPVKLARYVAVGANAVVNKDVLEENIAVAGVPARKVSNGGRLNWGKKKHE